MGALNKSYCEFANPQPGGIWCKADNNQPCAFVRYCGQESKWYHSNLYASCKKRVENLNKEKKENFIKPVSTEKVEKENIIEKFSEKEEKILHSGVIKVITTNYFVVVDSEGNGIRINGKCPQELNTIYEW
jgi:hypothetical protein